MKSRTVFGCPNPKGCTPSGAAQDVPWGGGLPWSGWITPGSCGLGRYCATAGPVQQGHPQHYPQDRSLFHVKQGAERRPCDST